MVGKDAGDEIDEAIAFLDEGDKACAAGVIVARKPRLVGGDHFSDPVEANAYDLDDPKRLGPHGLGWG